MSRNGANIEEELQAVIDWQEKSLKRAAKEKAKLRTALRETRRQLLTVAKLAAGTPQFFNPLAIADAKALRDHVLNHREDYR